MSNNSFFLPQEETPEAEVNEASRLAVIDGKEHASLDIQLPAVNHLQLSPDNETLAVCVPSRQESYAGVSLFHTRSGKLISSAVLPEEALSAAFLDNESVLVATEQALYRLSVRDGRVLYSTQGLKGRVCTAADGSLAALNADGIPIISRPDAAAQPIQGKLASAVTSMRFSSDGRKLVTCCSAFCLISDTRTGKELFRLAWT